MEVANNGREAVERVGREDFDLALMDVQMPAMDGLQATAAIRKLEDPKKAGLPIVAMTAHAGKGDRERCLAAGMDGYLSKPINARELIETIGLLHPAWMPRDERERPNAGALDAAAAAIEEPDSGGTDQSVGPCAVFSLRGGVGDFGGRSRPFPGDGSAFLPRLAKTAYENAGRRSGE